MSYYNICAGYRTIDWEGLFSRSSRYAIEKAISSPEVSIDQFASLLSPAAEEFLEQMAVAGHDLTVKNFGKTIQLYTPMYLSNYCDNQCLYCGFNIKNTIERRKLTLEEAEKEARFLAATGIRHLLVLTGESHSQSPVSYIKECIARVRDLFAAVSIEIYPLSESEYAELIAAGVDGLTIYQEVYDEQIYKKMHPKGPKSNYRFRLEAPERGARAGMHNVNIGPLFGLNDWRKEVFLTGLHAQYLQDTFPGVEIGASIPRIRPHAGSFGPLVDVSDKNIVQAILALRIFLPRLSLAVSTRENAAFRENLVPLGITRMSASSTTKVGGHTADNEKKSAIPQFEISDTRTVDEMMEMLKGKGYQPVLKDWDRI